MPLNEPLYEALTKLFGHVKVSSEGDKGAITKASPMDDKTLAARYADGEKYQVCCPVCGDDRYRLHISHWAYRDIRKGSRKVYVDGLMTCFNERCDLKPVRKQIEALVKGKKLKGVTFTESVCKWHTANEDVPMPGDDVPINDPAANAECREFLLSRGFDLDMLFHTWHVTAVDHLYNDPKEHPRIVYPVYNNGIRCFWQARLPFNPPKGGPPKYLTMAGSKKSDFLYNKDHALSLVEGDSPLVIVEGVTDVHKLGSDIASVASFGKAISTRQWEIIKWTPLSELRGVLMLDPDVGQEHIDGIVNEYGGTKVFRRGLHVARLPEGTDPGSLDYEALTSAIADAFSAGPVEGKGENYV